MTSPLDLLRAGYVLTDIGQLSRQDKTALRSATRRGQVRTGRNHGYPRAPRCWVWAGGFDGQATGAAVLAPLPPSILLD